MHKYYRTFAALFFSLFLNAAFAQQPYHLIPEPAATNIFPGKFLLNRNTVILAYNEEMKHKAALLNKAMSDHFNIELPVNATVGKQTNYITFSTMHKENNYPAEGYQLTISNNKIEIASKTAAGTFYGIQTLMQVLAETSSYSTQKSFPLSISQLSIADSPRFNYRGMHLDVARHFFPVKVVKRYIDFLAAYKFNRFHWHLTDDQGWRIEIKKYPKLTQVGGWRNGTIIGRYPGTGNDSLHYGGFYTQEEIKEVVRYAASKYIEVIPEIEMPGHASAAIAAYPQLSCFPQEDTKILATTPWAGPRTGKHVQQTWGVFEDVFCPTDFTFHFLEDVLVEVMPLFPSKYIHIGGDECPKESWKRSDFSQQLIQEKELKDEHGLQSYFIQRMEKYINSKGKKIIGWDEILEGGLAPNATVMSWRGEAGGIAAAKQEHEVIMTPQSYVYFDHTQSKNEDSVTIGGYNPVEKVYGYEPQPATLSPHEQSFILGAQANLWTEYIGNSNKIEYMIFPRMAALSEVLWSPAAKRNWINFEQKLPSLFSRLDAKKIQYSTAVYEMKDSLFNSNGKIGWFLQSRSPYTIRAAIKPGGSDTTTNAQSAKNYPLYTEPIEFFNSATGVAFLYDSAKDRIIQKIEKTFSFNKATAKKITLTTPPSSGYMGNGAFTLVDGIQNQKGLVKGTEFLGFAGKDLEAVIDLGENTSINEIKLHAFEQTGSWIYRPAFVEFYTSTDSVQFVLQDAVFNDQEKRHLVYSSRKNTQARFIKIIAKNAGIIATGLPGAGRPAWLFVHEVEVL